MLDGWGAALAGFCRERSPVAQITLVGMGSARLAWRTTSRSCATSTTDNLRTANSANTSTSSRAPVPSPPSTTWSSRSASTGDASDDRPTRLDDPAVDALLEELYRFSVRLEQAGLVVDPPLAPARARRRPPAAGRPVGRVPARGQRPAPAARPAGHVVGPQPGAPRGRGRVAPRPSRPVVAPVRSGSRNGRASRSPPTGSPACCCTPAASAPSPSSTSRSPRPGPVERSTAKPPGSSPTKRSAAPAGFRIRAQHRRAESEVLAREAELVAGFAELALRRVPHRDGPRPAIARRPDGGLGTGRRPMPASSSARSTDNTTSGRAPALPVGRVPTGRGRG